MMNAEHPRRRFRIHHSTFRVVPNTTTDSDGNGYCASPGKATPAQHPTALLSPPASPVTVRLSSRRSLEQFGSAPERLVYDRAAGTPKHIADVRRASDGQTQLVARQINYGQRHTRFAPSDFTLGPDGLTCPNDVTTTRAYRAGGADGFNYRFTASECQGCPLWEQCRDPKAKPDSHRTVFISDYALLCEPELAYLGTPAAQDDFSFRANIERHIAGLTQHHGARHAKSIGLPKVNFQLNMAATAYNLKRWHVLTREQERQGHKERPPCPTSLYPPP
jgi:hypothetical protein